jgi:hypothetical protein
MLGRDTSRDTACDKAGSDSGRTEQEAGSTCGERSLGDPWPHEPLVIVGIHVVAGERAANHEPVVGSMLHKRDVPGSVNAPGRLHRPLTLVEVARVTSPESDDGHAFLPLYLSAS